jgi:RNA polymerase sigma factor (sigma-70 family)
MGQAQPVTHAASTMVSRVTVRAGAPAADFTTMSRSFARNAQHRNGAADPGLTSPRSFRTATFLRYGALAFMRLGGPSVAADEGEGAGPRGGLATAFRVADAQRVRPGMTEGGLRSVFIAERPMLLRLLKARLGDPAEAEDALQDMWIKLETTETGPVSQPAAYLYRMAQNVALDRRRASARRSSRDSDWLESQSTAEELPDAEHILIVRERLARVQKTLAEMPERASMAFRLFRFEGLRQREIAERMNISQSAVEKLLNRALRQLVEIDNPKGGENGGGRRLSDQEDFQ